MNQFKRNNAGFTLIEVLIAMTILTVAFLGFYRLSTYTIGQINSADQRLLALNFATEGVEMVRNIRDTKLRNNFNVGWAEFTNLTGQDSNFTITQEGSSGYNLVPISDVDDLNQWEVLQPYEDPDNPDSYLSWKFYRKVVVSPAPEEFGDNLKRIDVEVAFEDRDEIVDRVTLSTYLGNIALVRW